MEKLDIKNKKDQQSELKTLNERYQEAIDNNREQIWLSNFDEKAKVKLNNIFKENKVELYKLNENVYDLLSDEDLIMSSYNKIVSNQATMIKGSKKKTADKLSLKKVENLKKRLQNKDFEFTKLKIVKIPKKVDKKRTLSISNFDERIIEENIRVILNAMYEPLFQFFECNHGFRPKRSTRTCMLRISEESKGMTTTIKGDIKEAYANLKPKILASILRDKICDEDFIQLIIQGMKVGTLTGKITDKKLFGLPEGSIVTPILFNIYMFEMDMRIISTTSKLLESVNTSEDRRNSTEARSKTSIHYKNEMRKIKLRIKKNSYKTDKNENKRKWRGRLKYKDLELHKKIRKEITELKKSYLYNKTSISQKKGALFFNYNRYADDFIILTNANKEVADVIRSNLAFFLKNSLNVELSIEKTFITDLKKEKATFLGFTIYDIKERKMIRTKEGVLKKLNVGLRIGIDTKMVLERLKKEGIIDNKQRPIHVNKFLILERHEIIQKFNQKIMGLVNYYHEAITMKSQVKYIIFLLQRSCEKTLAKKFNKSVRELKIRADLNLLTKYENKYKEGTKEIYLLEYKEIMAWAKNIEIRNKKNRYKKRKELKDIKHERINSIEMFQTDVYKFNMCNMEENIGIDDIFKGSFFERDPFKETKFNLRT